MIPALSAATQSTAALQLGDASTFQLGLVAVETVTVVLGLAIAAVAVQGYRRNDSRPMAFVSLGFVLLVGVPAVVSVGYLATALVPRSVLAVVGSVSELAGMASILYGLRYA